MRPATATKPSTTPTPGKRPHPGWLGSLVQVIFLAQGVATLEHTGVFRGLALHHHGRAV